MCSVLIVVVLSACSDDASPSPSDAGTAAETSTPAAPRADASTTLDASDPPPATLGTCTITVDGASYAYPPKSGGGSALAVKRTTSSSVEELNINCGVQDGQDGRVVQLNTQNAATTGSHTFVKNGTPAGLAQYRVTATDLITTKDGQRYTTDDGWTLSLTTSTAAEVAGTATFTGKRDNDTTKTKTVVLMFRLRVES